MLDKKGVFIKMMDYTIEEAIEIYYECMVDSNIGMVLISP